MKVFARRFLWYSLPVAALAYLVRSNAIDLTELVPRSGAGSWLIGAVLAVSLATAFGAQRLNVLTGATCRPMGFGESLRLGVVAAYYELALVGGVGADALRIVWIGRCLRDRVLAVAVVSVDRLLGLAGLLAAVALAVGASSSARPQTELVAVSTLAIGGLVGAAVGTLAIRHGLAPEGILDVAVLNHADWLASTVGFSRSLLGTRGNKTRLLVAFTLSVSLQALLILAAYSLGRGLLLPVSPSLRAIVFALPIAMATTALPLPAGGLGVGEVAFDRLLALCRDETGRPLEHGASLFVAFRVLLMIPALCGLPAQFMRGPWSHDHGASVQKAKEETQPMAGVTGPGDTDPRPDRAGS